MLPLSTVALIFSVPFAGIGKNWKRIFPRVVLFLITLSSIQLTIAFIFERSDKQWLLFILPLLGALPFVIGVWRLEASAWFRLLLLTEIFGFWLWVMFASAFVIARTAL